MPRGAKEEKDFIRKNLQQGLGVDEVITLVEKEYGHRISWLVHKNSAKM